MTREHFPTSASVSHPARLSPFPSSSSLRLAALRVLLGVLFPLSVAFSQVGSEATDSLSFRWKTLSSEQTAQEMERLRRGEYVQMSRGEFEEKLRQARARQEPPGPQLLETRYWATLRADSLAGTAHWRVRHPGPEPGILHLQPLNLALRQPRLVDSKKPEVVLTDLDGPEPGLLVEHPGESTVALDWSLRGEYGPGGLQFHLETPPCALAALELDLPRESAVKADGCVVSGPFPAGTAGRCLWRIAFSRRPAFDLQIRHFSSPEDTTPLIIARRFESRQTLSQNAVEVEFVFDLEVLRGQVQELLCQCDPHLRPYEVAAAHLEKWEIHQRSTPAEPLSLTLRWGEPLRSGTLVLRCLAPLGTANGKENPLWISPWLRLAQVVTRGETLIVQIPPQVALEDWHPGSFRLVEATRNAKGQTLRLVGGLLEEPEKELRGMGPGARNKGKETRGAKPLTPRPSPLASPQVGSRPRARVGTQRPLYWTRQQTWWEVGPAGSSVTTHLTYQVQRGRLFRLPLTLPPNYELERVEINPTSALRGWELHPESGRNSLLVDLQFPLSPVEEKDQKDLGGEGNPRENVPGTPLRLTIQLRSGVTQPGHPAASPRVLPFPDVVPVGAQWRETALALNFDEQRFEGIIGNAPPPRSPPEEEGPWGKQIPDYYWSFRGPVPPGQLLLKPLPPRLKARCTSTVVRSRGQPAVETTLTLEAREGSVQSLDVCVSAPAAGPWDWRVDNKTNSVQSFDRLPAWEAAAQMHLLAARDSFSGAALLTLRPPPQWRRLTLAQPLGPREPLVLHARSELHPAPGGDRWDIPLLGLPGASLMEGEVVLHLAGSDLLQLESQGLREAQAGGSRKTADFTWRTLRYSESFVALSLQGLNLKTDRGGEAFIDRVRLTSAAYPDGHLVHSFQFQVWNWQQPTLPLRLPCSSRLLGVRLDQAWLDRLPAAAEFEDTLQVELPVPLRPHRNEAGHWGLHRFQVVYASDGFPWRVWGRLETPSPILPLNPLGFRRTWRLPPRTLPLFEERYFKLPGAPTDRPWPSGRDLLESIARQSFRYLPLWSVDRWEPQQRQFWIDTASKVQMEAGRGLTLGKALETLVCSSPEGQNPPVLDVPALEEAGLAPSTPLPPRGSQTPYQIARPFWHGLGLVLCPARTAPLLTSREQWQAWQRTQPGLLSLPGPIEAAVAEALAQGHDSSGRFCRVEEWVGPAVENPAEERVSSPSLLPLDDLESSGWTEWEPIAGQNPGEPLLILGQDLPAAAGIALASLLVLIFWKVRHRPDPLVPRFFLGWLTGAGLGIFWLPGSFQELARWPLLVGGILGFLWYIWPAKRGSSLPQVPSATPAPVRATAILLAFLGATGLSGQSSPLPHPEPVPPTVLLLPGSPVSPSQQSVLVPTALAKHFIPHPSSLIPRPSGAVLVGASYTGKVAGERAELEGVFQVHNLAAGPATVLLPFEGIRLQEEVLLDETPAYLIAARPPQTGYLLHVASPGSHLLRLRFQVPVRSLAPQRQLQFTIPRLVQSRLVSLELPPEATAFQVLSTQGEVVEEKKGTYRVEIGRIKTPLQLSWREAKEPTAVPPVGRVTEAYLWNLRPEAALLQGVLHFRPLQGTFPSLTIQVPETLEVQQVHLRPTIPGHRAPGLQSWRLVGSGGLRHLEIAFQDPLTDSVYILLDLVPCQSLGERATLALPEPVGVQLDQGWLAYRADDLQARVANLGRLKGPYRPERDTSSLKPFEAFWEEARTTKPRFTAAFAFGTEPPGRPFLELNLSPAPAGGLIHQEVSWRIEPNQAEVKVHARLETPGADLALVEWSVPANLIIDRVAGWEGRDAVRNWSRSGNRVQAWLHRSEPLVDLELSGWLPLPEPREENRFQLPNIRPLSPKPGIGVVYLSASKGLTLEPARIGRLVPLAGPRWPDRELAYLAQEPQYSGEFLVRPAAALSDAGVLTILEVRDRQLLFTAKVDYRPRRGEVRDLKVRLKNWEGEEVKLEASQVAQGHELHHGSGDHTWNLVLQPGVLGPYRFSLSATRSLDEAGSRIPLPEVSFPGIGQVQHWVALLGPDLGLESLRPRGLETAGTPPDPQFRQHWPAEADRLAGRGLLSKVEGDPGEMSLLLRHRSQATGTVSVFLTERRDRVVDGQHWAHEALYWIFHQLPTDLNVTLPAGAKILSAAIDRITVTPGQLSPASWWIPLPGPAGARCFRLTWVYEPGTESFYRPRLETPTFPAANEGPIVWTLSVPPGFRGILATEATDPLTSPARMDLARAQAQFRLCARLSEQVSRPSSVMAQVAVVQRRFYQLCRNLECSLAATRPGQTLALADQDLAEALRKLKEENQHWARTHGLEEVCAEAERQVKMGQLALTTEERDLYDLASPGRIPTVGSRAGLPLCWQKDAPEALPEVRLVPDGNQYPTRALGFSLFLILLFLGGWVLSGLAPILAWLRTFWPEEVALLGGLGLLVYGVNLWPCLLILCGLGTRFYSLGRMVLRALRKISVFPSRQIQNS